MACASGSIGAEEEAGHARAERRKCSSPTDPRHYFVPRNVGKAGWVGVHLDSRTDWAQVAALVEQSWRLVAPKKLAAKIGEPRRASERHRDAREGRSPGSGPA
jgi:hypothetical protein